MLERFCAQAIHDELVSWVKGQITNSGKSEVAVVINDGLDSLIAADLCCSAVGKENVTGVALLYSPEEAQHVDKYADICKEMGIKFKRFNTTPCVDSMVIQYAINTDMGDGEDQISKNALNNLKIRLAIDMLRMWTDSTDKCICGHNNYSKITLGKFIRGGDNTSDFNPNAYLTNLELYEMMNKTMPNIRDIADKYVKKTEICDEISDEDIHRYIRGLRVSDDTTWHTLRDLEEESIKKRINIPSYKASDENLGRLYVMNIQS